MKIDTSTIENYDSMSAEEKLAALESFEYDDNSAKLEQTKAAFDRASKEVAEWKKKHNQLLSDDERKKQEADEALEAMQKELEELKREKFTSLYKAKGLALGMDEKTSETVSVAIVDGKIDAVFDAWGKFLKAHDKEIEVNLLKETPRAEGSDGEGAMTKEALKKLSPAERYKFSTEHPDEYKNIYGGNT